MSTQSHDDLIAAFQEYFKWQTKFEHPTAHSTDSGIQARRCLSNIRNAATIRRAEIMSKEKLRAAARKKVRGRPTRISKMNAP